MVEKIKIKDIEGPPDAITNLFKASDCSLGEYLNANKKPKIDYCVLIVTIILFLVFLSILWSLPSTFIHLCWENVLVTIIGWITSICLFLIAVGVMTPEEAGQKITDTIEQIHSK